MLLHRVRTCVAAGAVILSLAAGQPVKADGTLTLSYPGVVTGGSTGVGVDYTLKVGSTVYSSPSSAGTAASGPYFFNTASGSTISTFCIQITSPVPPNNTPVTFTQQSLANYLNNSSTTNAIEALYGKYYNGNWSTLSGAKGSSSANYVAFQLALWDLIYNGTGAGPNSLTTGPNFTSSDPNASLAQSMINYAVANDSNSATASSIFNSNPATAGDSLTALTSTCYQTQLYLCPPPPVGTVPAPPALLLAGIGIVALVGRARFCRRNAATA